MKILTIIARILLGLVFVLFGSNAFLHFLPMPPLPQGVTGEYLHAFFASGYVYVIGGFQVDRRLAFADRSLRSAGPDDSRCHHSEHLGIPSFDGTRGTAPRSRRYCS